MKTILLSVAWLSIFICSCSKEKDKALNYEKVNEVVNATGRTGTKIDLYNMLNENEKAFVWQSHLEKFLAADILTPKQRDIVQKAVQLINPDLFRNNEDLRGTLAKIEFEARSIFSQKNYFLVFESWWSKPADLNASDTPASLVAPGGIGGGPGGGSSCYCRSDGWCQLHTGSDLAGCLWNDEVAICVSTSTGCGLLSLSSCRGKCNVGSVIYDN